MYGQFGDFLAKNWPSEKNILQKKRGVQSGSKFWSILKNILQKMGGGYNRGPNFGLLRKIFYKFFKPSKMIKKFVFLSFFGHFGVISLVTKNAIFAIWIIKISY